MTIKPWVDRLIDNDIKGATAAMLAEIDELRAAMHTDQLLLEVARESAQRAIDELEKLQQQKPIAYLAWHDGKPCWSDDDCVCEDAVYPVHDDDDRVSMPVYLAPGAQPVPEGCKYPTCRSVDYQAELCEDLIAGRIAVPKGMVLVSVNQLRTWQVSDETIAMLEAAKP